MSFDDVRAPLTNPLANPVQSGVWTAIGFPVTDAAARARFYEYSNWCYQGGVFISRSSPLVLPQVTLNLEP